jgi:hypothetical protein
VAEDSLFRRADFMFAEGLGRPRAAPKVGAPAPLINALVVNSKRAIDELWKQRGYLEMTPDEIQERLGYRLDREEGKGWVLTGAMHKPLLSPREARFIGRRIDNSLGAKGALGKALAARKKRGTSNAALLQEAATLSLAPPPPEKAATSVPSPPAPPPPQPPPPPPAPPPVLQLPLPSRPADIERHANYLNELCAKARLEVAEATRAADLFEQIEWSRDEDGSYGMEEKEREFLTLDYKVALMKLKRAVPALDFEPDDVMSGEYAKRALSLPCRCGNGRALAFPWLPDLEAYNRCSCDFDDWTQWRYNIIKGTGHP